MGSFNTTFRSSTCVFFCKQINRSAKEVVKGKKNNKNLKIPSVM